MFTDKFLRSAKAGRPGLAAMLDYPRAGDTVVVTAIDRFGRPSPKSSAPSPISVSDESSRAPYAKDPTRLPRPAAR